MEKVIKREGEQIVINEVKRETSLQVYRPNHNEEKKQVYERNVSPSGQN